MVVVNSWGEGAAQFAGTKQNAGLSYLARTSIGNLGDYSPTNQTNFTTISIPGCTPTTKQASAAAAGAAGGGGANASTTTNATDAKEDGLHNLLARGTACQLDKADLAFWYVCLAVYLG